MGFFEKKAWGVVLIDISSASVGGAFMYEKAGQVPVLCYTARHYVNKREGEKIADATIRTLEGMCAALVSEGAACLYREAGTAHIDMVLASVSAPWQDTAVRTVSINGDHSFVFTRALMQKAVLETPATRDRVVSDTSIISTSLNGYEMDKPWGRRADRADVTVLTSTLDREIAKDITTTIRRAFHSHTVDITAFAPVAYAVIGNLYPHQEDFVLIDVADMATNAIIVKKGVLAGVRSIPRGVRDSSLARRATGSSEVMDLRGSADPSTKYAEAEALWLADMKQVLADFASEHPLPRSVFLLADEHDREALKRLIDSSTLRTLWLSDEPLSVIPLAPEHTANVVRARGLAEGDIYLSMLALFYRERIKNNEK